MAIHKWCQETKVEWHHIAPGKPTQNSFVESFKGSGSHQKQIKLVAGQHHPSKFAMKLAMEMRHETRLKTQYYPENWKEVGSDVWTSPME